MLPPPPVAAPPRANGDGPSPTVAAPATSTVPEYVAAVGARLIGTLDSVLAGKHETTEVAVTTLFAGGHLLIEDVPGVGKTLLAQALARAVGGTFGRIQGTSDLLPGDVTGSLFPTPDGHGMAFRAGPVFANVVVFDELNRATPRTQSALLEVTEEATVTIDGVSHGLPSPFMLVATQNPIEIAGTYGLSEGALDRFAAVVVPGRATAEHERDVLTGRSGRTMLSAIEAVVPLDDIDRVQRWVAGIHVADEVAGYVVDLLAATRAHPHVRLGASTRGGVALIGLARARAALHGRTYVVPDDVVGLATAALGHRVLVHDGAGATTAGREIVAECLAALRPPAV